MLKVTDVAKRLNCSIATVYQLVESKRLPHYRCPGIRVSEAQLTEFLETTRRGPMVDSQPTRQSSRVPLKLIKLPR